MPAASQNRLFVYVDESGQDTQGQFFVVSVVVLATEYDTILNQLEAAEYRSRKGRAKWHRARYAYRQAYIDEITNLTRLSRSLFFEVFRNSRDYIQLTVDATANAVQRKAQQTTQVNVFVDGLRKNEAAHFGRLLRARSTGIRKVRGIQKEENNALIRLADALCGLVRDAEDGQPWAVGALQRLQRNGLVEAI